MDVDRIRRVERVERAIKTRTAMDSREKENEKKRHDRINGNLAHMKEQGEQRRQREQSKEKQNQRETRTNDTATQRINVKNPDVNEIKQQMESSGKIQDLRDRLQGKTTDTIKSIKAGRKKVIEAYEKNIEVDEGER